MSCNSFSLCLLFWWHRRLFFLVITIHYRLILIELIQYCSRLESQQLVYDRARQVSWVTPRWRLAFPQYVRCQVGIFNNRSSKPDHVHNHVCKVLVFANTYELVRTCSGRKWSQTWLQAFCERVSLEISLFCQMIALNIQIKCHLERLKQL